MTKMFLSGMVNRDKGVVVNVASASAYNPYPYLGVYSSSKVCLVMPKSPESKLAR